MPKERQECSKIYVKLSNEVIDKLDEIAHSRGLSRSGLIAYYLGNAVEKEIMTTQAIKNIMTPSGMGSLLNTLGTDENGLVDAILKSINEK